MSDHVLRNRCIAVSHLSILRPKAFTRLAAQNSIIIIPSHWLTLTKAWVALSEHKYASGTVEEVIPSDESETNDEDHKTERNLHDLAFVPELFPRHNKVATEKRFVQVYK